MSDQLRSALVRVPCSTSNLGSGYDTIGLALNRYLEVGFTPDDRGTLVIEREGTLTALTDHGGPDLVATTFETVLAEAGLLPSGVLRLRSDIPIARGLGSSSAALLAGYDLGRAVCGMSTTTTECTRPDVVSGISRITRDRATFPSDTRRRRSTPVTRWLSSTTRRVSSKKS